jgi:hypothetical protein
VAVNPLAFLIVRRQYLRRLVPLAVIAVLAFAAPARAQSARVTTMVPRVVDVAPLSDYRPHLDDRALEGEVWDYACWFPSGHRLFAQFQVTNAGPGRQTGLVAGIVIFPDQTTRLIKNSRPRAEWSFDVRGDEVTLSLARHVFEIGPRRHHVHIEGRTDRFDFEAQATLPAVLMGPVRYGDRDTYDMSVLAPRFRVTATVQVAGKSPITLTDGWGVALHSTSTLPDQQQALAIARFHTFDQPTQISMFAFTVPGERGGGRVGWLLAIRDGRIDLAPVFDRQFGGEVKETEDPGYSSPRTLWLKGSALSGIEASTSLTLAARFDIIDWINTALGRFVARRRFHPVEYVFDAPYELKTSAGTTTGQGLALLWILNQPRGAPWP